MGKMIVSDLTDRLVMARGLILLIETGVIARSKAMDAAEVLGIGKDDLARALSEYDPRQPSRFRVQDLPVKPDTRAPAAYPERHTSPTVIDGQGRVKRHSNRRLNDQGEPERRCSRCGEWKPANPEYFAVKDSKTGQIRADCRECYNRSQRRTYLSNAEQELIEGVLTFVVDENDKIIGITCAKCGEPILVGEEVEASTDIRHTSCTLH